MVDIRQSIHYANYLRHEGWVIERIAETNYFIKKLPLFGSILKVQRPEEVRIDTIRQLARKYRVFQTIIEPNLEFDMRLLMANGYSLSSSPYLPTKTLQIDLTKSKDYIFRHFKKDARQAIRRATALSERSESKGEETNNIKSYSTESEIKKFREEWQNSVNFKRFVPSLRTLINLRKSFPANNSVFLASHNISSRIISGVIFTRSSHDICYYWQAFTNSEGRTSLTQYSLLWEGLLWAKKMGCKIFDFEGIYDERFPNKSWLGFTHFKKSFGGTEISYPGCYTKLRFPI